MRITPLTPGELIYLLQKNIIPNNLLRSSLLKVHTETIETLTEDRRLTICSTLPFFTDQCFTEIVFVFMGMYPSHVYRIISQILQ